MFHNITLFGKGAITVRIQEMSKFTKYMIYDIDLPSRTDQRGMDLHSAGGKNGPGIERKSSMGPLSRPEATWGATGGRRNAYIPVTGYAQF